MHLNSYLYFYIHDNIETSVKIYLWPTIDRKQARYDTPYLRIDWSYNKLFSIDVSNLNETAIAYAVYHMILSIVSYDAIHSTYTMAQSSALDPRVTNCWTGAQVLC